MGALISLKIFFVAANVSPVQLNFRFTTSESEKSWFSVEGRKVESFSHKGKLSILDFFSNERNESECRWWWYIYAAPVSRVAMCMRWLMSELSWSHSSLSLNLARERLKKCKSERERKTKTSEWIIYDGEWRLNGNCLKPATAFAFIIDSAFNFHSKRHLTSLLLIKNLSLPLSLPKTRQWSIASLSSERFYFNFSNYSLQVSEPWRALSIKRDTTRRKIWFSFLLLSITKSRLFRKNEMQVFTERGKKKHTQRKI